MTVCLQIGSDKMAANTSVFAMMMIGLFGCDVTGASRILLLSAAHRSNMIYFMEAGIALQKAGHDVYMLVSEFNNNFSVTIIHSIVFVVVYSYLSVNQSKSRMRFSQK